MLSCPAFATLVAFLTAASHAPGSPAGIDSAIAVTGKAGTVGQRPLGNFTGALHIASLQRDERSGLLILLGSVNGEAHDERGTTWTVWHQPVAMLAAWAPAVLPARKGQAFAIDPAPVRLAMMDLVIDLGRFEIERTGRGANEQTASGSDGACRTS